MKRPPGLQAIFDALQSGDPFESIDEVNRALQTRLDAYNRRGQPELGGLSPDDLQQLLGGDWSSTGALRVSERLTIDDLAGVPFFADARTLLQYVAARGSVKETPAQNLTRATVAELLPLLRMPTHDAPAFAAKAPPPKNEHDVLWLSALRLTLLFAGLLARRKGLRITRRARSRSTGSRRRLATGRRQRHSRTPRGERVPRTRRPRQRVLIFHLDRDASSPGQTS